MTRPDAAATRRNRFTPLSPDEESAALADRLGEWERSYEPEAGYQEWVLARVVIATVRLDRNLAHESVVRAYEAERADLSWDDDRRLEAEELGAKIHKDPARVRKRLEETRQGADWIIERWEALGKIAGSGREWSEPQRALALDLLGIAPSLRDGPSPFEPSPTETSAAAQASVALAERQRLARLRDRLLVARDEREHALASSGVTFSLSPAMVRLRRDESFWTREFHRAQAEFRRAGLRPTDAPSPRSAVVPPPEPEPEPEPVFAPDPTRSAPSMADLAALDRMIMAQLMQARQAKGIDDPFEAVDLRPAAAVAPVSSATPSSPPPGNRHARRAQEARSRAQG